MQFIEMAFVPINNCHKKAGLDNFDNLDNYQYYEIQ